MICFHCGVDGDSVQAGSCSCLTCASDSAAIGPCAACVGRQKSARETSVLDPRNVLNWYLTRPEAPSKPFRRLKL